MAAPALWSDALTAGTKRSGTEHPSSPQAAGLLKMTHQSDTTVPGASCDVERVAKTASLLRDRLEPFSASN